MALNATLEYAQANLYQLLNQLDAGDLDKVIVLDKGVEVAQIVTWAVYVAADPGGAVGVEIDVVAAYSKSPAMYATSLYKMTKNMRDRQAGADAQPGTGSVTCVAKALLVSGELVTLTDTAGVAANFEFDTTGGGVTPGNVQVDVSGDTTASDVATTLQAAVAGDAIEVTAVKVGDGVNFTQDKPGTAGNTTIVETVADVGFLSSGFSGGTDVGAGAGVIALKTTKNDATPRAAMVPADHALTIGL